MLKIKCPVNKSSNIKSVNDVEIHFRALVMRGEKFEADTYTDIMKAIDPIKTRNGNIIETKFGETLISELSSGCKAVILAVYYAKKGIYVSIDECGENALKVLFKYAEKMDIHVVANGPIVVPDNEIECIINGKCYKGGYDIYRKMVEICE